jgi:hypothetical protein
VSTVYLIAWIDKKVDIRTHAARKDGHGNGVIAGRRMNHERCRGDGSKWRFFPHPSVPRFHRQTDFFTVGGIGSENILVCRPLVGGQRPAQYPPSTKKWTYLSTPGIRRFFVRSFPHTGSTLSTHRGRDRGGQ